MSDTRTTATLAEAERANSDDDRQRRRGGRGGSQPLALEVKVDTRSTCERHITVTIPREDIERYFDKEFTELMPTAQVPGFRPGRAPRKLVETRFRKEIADKVKSGC